MTGDFGDVSVLPNLSELEVAKMIQKEPTDSSSEYILQLGKRFISNKLVQRNTKLRAFNGQSHLLILISGLPLTQTALKSLTYALVRSCGIAILCVK